MLRVMEKHPYWRISLPHLGLHKNTEKRLLRFEWMLARYPNLYTDLSFGFYQFHVEGFESLAEWRTRSHEYLTRNAGKVMFASDMVLEPTKDEPYIENTLRSYMQLLESEAFRFFLVPKRTMHGLHLDDDTLHNIYETTPARFLLLDDKGHLPDRTKGWPIAGVPVPPRPPVAPLDPSRIPPEK
jgi:hypothetical protein